MFKSLLLASSLLLSASACVVGAPPGFSSGDLWTVPLVAPLEKGQLLVPVSIEGKGPYLFLIDPDSPDSSIDTSIATGLKLRRPRTSSKLGSSRQTEDDHLERVGTVQVNKMTIGTLSIRQMVIRVHSDNTYWVGGRRVHGVLGRDVIADSLVYSFNRDQGLLYIATQGNLKVPEDAIPLTFTQSYGKHRRYISKIQINQKHNMTMHLDLGAPTSMLWPEMSSKLKLPKVPAKVDLVDEYGIRRRVNSGSIAGIVGTKTIQSSAIVMLPYADKRIEREDMDGIIGQNFWSKYNVTVNWHRKRFYLQERNRDLAANASARLARWGDDLADCENPACVVATMKVDNAPSSQAPGTVPANDPIPGPEIETAPPADAATSANVPGFAPHVVGMLRVEVLEPQYSLHFEREAKGSEFAYDVVVAAVDENGKALALPTFLVSFQAGVTSLSIPALSPSYADAKAFTVIDMNPVGTMGCQGAKCIYKQPVQW